MQKTENAAPARSTSTSVPSLLLFLIAIAQPLLSGCNDYTPPLETPTQAAACDGFPQPVEGEVTDSPWDGDGDGFPDATHADCANLPEEKGDCDDNDPAVAPIATELCDGKDTNCDGTLDPEEVDQDGDNWVACEPLEANHDFGLAIDGGGDCDDDTSSIHPGAPEHCDGVDEDCDGSIDEEPIGTTLYYVDGDQDGFGADPAVPSCTQPVGYVAVDGDCDDTDAAIHAGAPETCNGVDDDCDNTPDNVPDGDRDGVTICQGDCDDTDDGVHPTALEHCDGVDEDCDEEVDEDARDPQSYYVDGDGDGHGGPSPVVACTPPDNVVTNHDDCDDTDDTIHPGAPEGCTQTPDGKDQDCDGRTDERPLCGEIDPGDADVLLMSVVTGEEASRTLGGRADLTGDAVADIRVGAPASNGNSGGVYLVHGGDSLLGTVYLDNGAVADPFVAEYVAYPSSGGYLGGEMSDAVDLTGDSVPDFLVGSTNVNGPAVCLAYGAQQPGDLLFELCQGTSAELPNPGRGGGFGMGVAVGGNLLGDAGDGATPDIAVTIFNHAHPQTTNPVGGAVVYDGWFNTAAAFAPSEVGWAIYGQGPRLGTTIEIVGDVDQDGCDDLLLGGELQTAAYLVFGQCDTPTPTSVFLDPSPEPGVAIAFWGGVNLVGAAGRCDLDGDDIPDVILGDSHTHSNGNYAGSVYVFYGKDLMRGVTEVNLAALPTVPRATLVGETNSLAGSAVACGGDLNDDGIDDLVVGAPNWDPPNVTTHPGAAYVVYSEPDGTGIGGLIQGVRALATADVRIHGKFKQLGWSVAPLGDVNGDGSHDFAVGAASVDAAGHSGAYVWFGGER